MDSITEESVRFVDGLPVSTEKNGETDPTKYCDLNSMNVMFSTCFGRKFEPVEDPEFVDLDDTAKIGMKFAGVENDMANFLPVFAVAVCFLVHRQK